MKHALDFDYLNYDKIKEMYKDINEIRNKNIKSPYDNVKKIITDKYINPYERIYAYTLLNNISQGYKFYSDMNILYGLLKQAYNIKINDFIFYNDGLFNMINYLCSVIKFDDVYDDIFIKTDEHTMGFNFLYTKYIQLKNK